ncbi:MAG: heavy-metal-associated domain-containing protein [Bacteroidales bacterium]|nr:heavy-metal-associated domain-containing protein [Bacteroidales bacterium]
MKTLKFKTNLECPNCEARVKPFLDKKEGVTSWQVDTDHPDKILTVETESLEAKDIIKIIKRTGFVAEEM